MIGRILKAVKRPPHIEVVRGPLCWVRIVGANGEITLSSETFSCESNAWRAACVLEAATGWKVVEK